MAWPDPATLLQCNDDAVAPSPCADTLQSSVSVPVIAGNCYKVRVGGFQGAQGTGTITITKEDKKCPEDINGDGAVNVLDLIDLLLCFGQPALPSCDREDTNNDGVVNVLDLIDLLLVFGTVCQVNDACENREPIFNGQTPFSTLDPHHR